MLDSKTADSKAIEYKTQTAKLQATEQQVAK